MKGNTKRIKAAEPAPVDGMEVIDRREFEERLDKVQDEIYRVVRDENAYFESEIKIIENKNKMMIAVGSVIAAAICFIVAMKKGE